ncbi:unnamed protein product, partial [Phaeothamnion confervicola]
VENGKQTSQRHFLLEARTGDVVLPILEPLQGLRVMLITPEASVLVPSRLEGFGATAAGPQGMTQFVEQVDRWINGLSMALAEVVGVAPDNAQAATAGSSIEAQPGTAVTARSGIVWVESSDAELAYCDG